ncbi:cupin domain-containing protein [Streptomyces sp. NPDC002055]|uniref:cupin domain-containing protein n=1 Tax=Streptomyces sp. NPDC002055 TaxID=3154534 RepID=UPI003320BAAE
MAEYKEFGIIIRRAELEFTEEDGVLVSRPVGPHVAAEHVSVDIVRIPPGRSWNHTRYTEEETTAIVFTGSGTARIGDRTETVNKGATAYAPTGLPIGYTADGDAELTVYFWRAPLPEGAKRGSDPTLFNTVHDSSAGIRQFAGTGEIAPVDNELRAFMNFPHWPGNGCAHLCINTGMAAPGNTFNIHGHPGAEDALFALEGRGQFFLGDQWIDVGPGDGVYARTGALHGTRNPDRADAAPLFISVGGPAPFDAALYRAAGLSPEVV